MFINVVLPLVITVVVIAILYGAEKARSSKSLWWKRQVK